MINLKLAESQQITDKPKALPWKPDINPSSHYDTKLGFIVSITILIIGVAILCN